MKTEKIAIVLTNHDALGNTGRKTGFHLAEATHAHKVFVDAGYTVEFISPNGGLAPMDSAKRDDPVNAAFLDNSSYIEQTRNTLAAGTLKPTDYRAVYFAGGHGTMFDLPDSVAVQSFTARVYENGGVVGAVCHGPAGLVNVKLSDGAYLVAGKSINSFTNEEETAVKLTDVMPFLLESKLIARGATFSKTNNFQKHVVVSERLVTGQNPASAMGVAEQMVSLLRSQK
jgi:putative intracellular protease/amidase